MKLALRQLAKSPGFTAIAVLSLALGIGACTAVFSLCQAILLRSLPVPNPHGLRVVRWSGTDERIPSINGTTKRTGDRTTGDSVPHPLFLALREHSTPVADVFGFAPIRETVVRAAGEPFVADGMMVSDNFFPALGVQPLLGRLFRAGDDQPAAGPNVIITQNGWETHFARDPAVVGRTLTLNHTTFTIIGVLRREFAGVHPGAPPAFYVPMQAGSPFLWTDIAATRHWFVRLMARLKPAGDGEDRVRATDAQLQAVLAPVFARHAASVLKDTAIQVEPGRSGLTVERDTYRKPLLLMAAIVGLVMLIACANLAGLSLARGAARQHELAVRVALGSGRWRLIRQSLLESIVLASLGGALGVMIAIWGKSALGRLLANSPEGLRYDLSLNFAVLGFAFAAAAVTAVLVGLLPAWGASRVDPLDGLKARGALAAPRLRIGKALVAAQIGLSLLLLTAAGLYLRSLANLRQLNAGFVTEKLLVFEINPHGVGYKDARLTAFYAHAQDALGQIPGVQSAALVQYPLLANRRWGIGFSLPGKPPRPESELQASRLTVGEAFFQTLGIPIVQGRALAVSDVTGAPNALVVNQAFVRKFFPDENPLGQRVEIHDVTWQIVGVCGDAKYDNIKHEVGPTVYTSFRQYAIRNATSFVVRAALPPSALAAAVRKAVAALDSNVPVAKLTTQDALLNSNLGQERLLASLCGTLAGLALLLSCIGLYGLMAYHVARRRGEIAIRVAIGAQSRDIARIILREALVLAIIGVALGLPAAFAGARLIQSQLHGVSAHDPAILAVVTLVLVIVAVVAAWLPARRAMKVDPMIALRAE